MNDKDEYVGPIGLFGGTFNPIHYGHLRIALEVAEARHLKRVVFLPNQIPPHRGEPSVTAEDRLNMARLAIADNPLFCVDAIEAESTGYERSYTVNTLTALKYQHPRAEFTFICGSDSLMHSKWYRLNDILDMLADFCVVFRPGCSREDFELNLRQKLHIDSPKISWLQTPGITISSTDIRGLIQRGLSVRYLVPPAVEEYIEQHRLYRTA